MNSPFLFVDLPPSKLHPWPPSRIHMKDKPLSADAIEAGLKRMPSKYRRIFENLVNESVRPGIPREVTAHHCFDLVTAQYRKDESRKAAKEAPGLFGDQTPIKRKKKTALPDLV